MEKEKNQTPGSRIRALWLKLRQIRIVLSILVLALSLSFLPRPRPVSSVVLTRNGKPVLTILVDNTILPLDGPQAVTLKDGQGGKPVDGIAEQRRAVREFVKYIKQMSGAELKVKAAESGAIGCYIGLSSSFPWLNQDLKNLGAEGFIIRSTGKNLYLLAEAPLGVRQAVNTFLMDHGCRWFFPGTTWEVIPDKPTIGGTYNLRQIPTYDLGRDPWIGYGVNSQSAKEYADWMYHNRLGGPQPVEMGHCWYGINREKDFAAHPEWFALVDGKRKNNKVCYSNPEVIKQMIKYAMDRAASGAASVSLTPDDGLGYCECEQCRSSAKGSEVKSDKGSWFATRPDGVLICTVSESLFTAVNQVAKAVAQKYPNFMLGCYGYSAYSHPPSFKLEPNVFVQTTTEYRRTPLSLEDQIDQWGQRSSHVGIYGYWSVYQWDWDGPVMGKFVPEKIQEDLQFYHKHNVTAIRTEICNNWAPRGLGYYIASQLLWNVNADVKPLIRDFYEKAFGPAAQAMERYYTRWYGPSVAVMNPTPGKSGLTTDLKSIGLDEMVSYNSRKYLASKASLTAAFRDMDEAARLTAGKPAYEQRIDQLRMYTYYLLLREKVREASITKDKTAIVEAIKNETEFGGRLTYTNMIHTRPLLGKAFDRLFKDYEALLKDIPESQTEGKGWRRIGDPATHEELEQLWAQGKKYLGI